MLSPETAAQRGRTPSPQPRKAPSPQPGRIRHWAAATSRPAAGKFIEYLQKHYLI